MEGTCNLRVYFVIVLVVIFGSGSWITVSGTWSEVPVLIQEGIPEQYKINSYIVIIIQLASVSPVLFLILNYFAPDHIYRLEIPANYVITVIGTLAAFLLIFFWDIRTFWPIDGRLHSTAFLILLCFLALVDSTTNVTFVGFMSILKENYLNWFWVGQGLSSFLPAVMAIIQSFSGGIGGSCVANYTFINETISGNDLVLQNCTSWSKQTHSLLFAPEYFFFFLFVMMLFCHLSFICLNTLHCVKSEYAPTQDGRHLRRSFCGGLLQTDDTTVSTEFEQLSLITGTPETSDSLLDLNNEPISTEQFPVHQTRLSNARYAVLYTTLLLDTFIMYGALPSVQSYSSGAYGHSTYLVIVPLREMIKTVSYLIFLVKPLNSFKIVFLTFFIGVIAAVYCYVVAVMSPSPPFRDLLVGKVLIVASWLLEGMFLTYCKVAIIWILRNGPNNRKHLMWSGIVVNLGALLGSILMFPLVNTLNLFHAYDGDKCADVPTCRNI